MTNRAWLGPQQPLGPRIPGGSRRCARSSATVVSKSSGPSSCPCDVRSVSAAHSAVVVWSGSVRNGLGFSRIDGRVVTPRTCGGSTLSDHADLTVSNASPTRSQRSPPPPTTARDAKQRRQREELSEGHGCFDEWYRGGLASLGARCRRFRLRAGGGHAHLGPIHAGPQCRARSRHRAAQS